MLLSTSHLTLLCLQSSPAFRQPFSGAAFGGAAMSRWHPDITQVGSNDCATHDAGIWAAKEPGSFWKQCIWGELPALSGTIISLAVRHCRADRLPWHCRRPLAPALLAVALEAAQPVARLR